MGSSDDGDGGTPEAGNASLWADDDTQGEESSFWMSLEDFVREFSEASDYVTWSPVLHAPKKAVALKANVRSGEYEARRDARHRDKNRRVLAFRSSPTVTPLFPSLSLLLPAGDLSLDLDPFLLHRTILVSAIHLPHVRRGANQQDPLAQDLPRSMVTGRYPNRVWWWLPIRLLRAGKGVKG